MHLEGDLEFYQPARFFLSWKKQHSQNLAALERTIQDFKPEIFFVWGMWALSKSLPALAERLMPGRVVYYLSDYWLDAEDMHTAFWNSPANRRLMSVPKSVLSKIALALLASSGHPELKLERVMCVSARVRDLLVEKGWPIEHARIIHGGTDIERFKNGHRSYELSGQVQLLYAGQLVRHKGVHTAIEAMERLVSINTLNQVHLTLVGSGHPEYEARLHDLVQEKHLQEYVTFQRPVSREDMPAIFHKFNFLIFPSIYEEPLARIVQEAMAAGLVVIGTTTGGTGEILVEDETGLTFRPQDADGLAMQVCRLLVDPGLSARLAQSGRNVVTSKFTLSRMVDEIESFLLE